MEISHFMHYFLMIIFLLQTIAENLNAGKKKAYFLKIKLNKMLDEMIILLSTAATV